LGVDYACPIRPESQISMLGVNWAYGSIITIDQKPSRLKKNTVKHGLKFNSALVAQGIEHRFPNAFNGLLETLKISVFLGKNTVF